MANTIGTAYVQILPTTQGITESLTSALTDASDDAGKKSSGSFASSFGSGLKSAAGVIAGAATAATTAVIAAANSTAQAGDEIDKTSQKVGVSAEEWQALSYAAEHAGFEASAFQTAARNLAGTDFSGNVYDAVNAIMELGTAEERNAAAAELFGERSAQQMAALFNGTMSADEYAAALEALGGMMSNEAVASAAAYEDAMTDMQTAVGGVVNSLMAEMLPSMIGVMNGVAQLAAGNMEGIEMITESIDTFFNGLIDKVPELVGIAGNMVVKLAEGIIQNLPKILEVGVSTIYTFANGLTAQLPVLIPEAVNMIVSLVTGLLDNLPMLVEAALQLMVGLAVGLVQAIPQLIEQAPTIIEALINAVVEIIPDMIEAGGQLIEGLASGIVAGLSSLLDTVKGVAAKVVESIKSFFGIHSPSRLFRDEIGSQLMAGFALGITDNVDEVQNAIDDVNAITTSAMSGNMNLNASVSSSGSVASSSADTSERFAFDFYIDGRRLTDAVTLRQRQTARALG